MALGAMDASTACAAIRPVQTRCEYKVNPLGIDALNPRLSWKLESDARDERGQKQTAYQILVATDQRGLASDRGDLWDTGKVDSDRNAQVVYAGKTLISGMDCWWKVRVWDNAGRASPWSSPGRWSMGLLHATDWAAAAGSG